MANAFAYVLPVCNTHYATEPSCSAIQTIWCVAVTNFFILFFQTSRSPCTDLIWKFPFVLVFFFLQVLFNATECIVELVRMVCKWKPQFFPFVSKLVIFPYLVFFLIHFTMYIYQQWGKINFFFFKIDKS